MNSKLISVLAIASIAISAPSLAEDARTSAEAEKPGVSRPGDVSPPVAQAMVDDVNLGVAVGSDGRIPGKSLRDSFLAGEQIHVTMDVSDAPPGSKVRVVWVGPSDQRIAEQMQTVAAGTSMLKFVKQDTRTWAPGDYRAEVWVGDEKVNDERFSIVSARSASK